MTAFAVASDPREPVAVQKRKPLTRREALQLCIDQNGRCGCGCEKPLDAIREGIIDEHLIPLAQGGSNDLRNRQLWRKPCSDEKTRRDSAATAKCKRIEDREDGTRRPRKPIPQPANPWGPKGVRKLQSRNSFKRRFPDV